MVCTKLQKKYADTSEYMNHGKFCLVRELHQSSVRKPGITSRVIRWVTYFIDLVADHPVSMEYKLQYTITEDIPPHKEYVMDSDLSCNMRAKPKQSF